jgi:hypothetical protein
MTCEEARLLIGADPNHATAELLAHLETCPECLVYRRQMQALNAKIRRALELNLEDTRKAAAPTSNVTILPRKPAGPPVVARHTRPRLMAFAASLVAASIVGLTLWLTRPPESLAAEIVKHVEGEPKSWSKTEPVASERLAAVLRKSNVRLGPNTPSIVYASSCWFRGHFVPHLVVATEDGPVTVMILMNEKVSAASKFNEEGYSGLLVPAPTGSVAVLSRTPMPLEKPATNMVEALQAVD